MPHWEGPEDAPTAIDLFAGCGGMTQGAMQAGYRVCGAWEVAAAERYTYHVHHCEPNAIAQHGDATDVDPSKVPDDLAAIFAGPSCQGFSSSGGEIDPDDPRNELPFSVIDWVEATDPQLVVIENVVGMKDLHGPLHEALVDELAAAGEGYRVNTLDLNAADYGVPQQRERVFIVGVRVDRPEPVTTRPPIVRADGRGTDAIDEDTPVSIYAIGEDGFKGYRTAREALEDLPEPLASHRPVDDPVHVDLHSYAVYRDDDTDEYRVDPHSTPEPVERGGETVWMPTNHVAQNHQDSTRERLAEMELGHSGDRTTARRLDPDEAAPTMTVSNGTPPVHYQGRAPWRLDGDVGRVRRLTVREVARIQTFPDWYTFAGNKKEQYRQAGNAVPPLLAEHVAAHYREVLE